MSYTRFALYYIPPKGPLADFGAAWLGWDVGAGRAAVQPDLPGLQEVTRAPRKYGFHGTLKPPFRLAEGQSRAALEAATARMAASLVPALCDGLDLTALGRFLALTPRGDTRALQHVAETCVRDLDPFRAPPRAAELARRRKAGLSARQETLLRRWGYPYVFEEFRFHLTLTGRLPGDALAGWTETLARRLPDLPAPFAVDQIALCGERADGRFEVVDRYSLGG